MRTPLLLLFAIPLAACQPMPGAIAQQQAVIAEPLAPTIDMSRFDICTSDWVSLHFFAFHAARHLEGGDYGYRGVPLSAEDAALLEQPEIRAAFQPLADLYAPALKGRLFRGALFKLARSLGEGVETIEEAEIRAAFEAFMPTYRQAFWPRHGALAEEAASELRAALAVHGPALMAATADELDASWGDGHYAAYMSAYVNWAGAFSNDNILFFSASDPAYRRHRLEMFVHETAHGDPIGRTTKPAADAALAAHGLKSDRFHHYLQFYATGRAAKRVLGPDYKLYVETQGNRERADAKPWYDALEKVWDQHETLEARAMAAARIVAAQD